jgi:hypothetical protein
MAHFEELLPRTYFGRWSDRLVAVGWLAPEKGYRKGEVSGEFFDALFLVFLSSAYGAYYMRCAVLSMSVRSADGPAGLRVCLLPCPPTAL